MPECLSNTQTSVHNYQAFNYLLGEGSSSNVFLGRNVHSDELVALKITDCSNFSKSKMEYVRSEVNILKKVASLESKEDLLALYDVIEQGSEVCLVTEFIDGGDLESYFNEFPSGIPERIAKWIFKKLLCAVAILHNNNICHRDIKLENVMYNKEIHKLKLIDFGFAASANENVLHTDCCGSIHYAAPEVIKRIPYDGKKADVWSLGIILFVLLSGLFPFDDISNRTEIIFDKIVAGEFFLPSFLSSEVSPLLRSMLQKDPKKRPDVNEILNHPWFVAHR